MVWGILECLGNQGRLGLPTGGGMEKRVHKDIRLDEGGQERGLVGGGGGWGVSWGPRQLAGLGSREGPGQTVIIIFLGLGEKGERTMLGPQERGAVSGPRMAHGAQGHVSLLSTSLSLHYLMQNLSPRVPCPCPPLPTTCP